MSESHHDKLGMKGKSTGFEVIFVVGNSRSGTTLMGRILGRHPTVFTFHELHFFEELWDPSRASKLINTSQAINIFARLLASQRLGYLRREDHHPFMAEAEAGLAMGGSSISAVEVFRQFLRYEAGKYGGVIACDQTPRNVYFIGEILQSLPEARIVQMVRDPRDVLLSQKNKWRRRSLGAVNIPRREAVRAWVNYHPITMSMIWRSGILAGTGYRNHPRVVTVTFEHLLEDPAGQIQLVCNRLSIDFQSAMLDVPKTGSSLDFDRRTSTGVDPNFTQRWREGGLSPTEIHISQRITESEMRMWGYTPEPITASFLIVMWLAFTWMVKSTLAIFFNLHRARNFWEASRRRLGLSTRNNPVSSI